MDLPRAPTKDAVREYGLLMWEGATAKAQSKQSDVLVQTIFPVSLLASWYAAYLLFFNIVLGAALLVLCGIGFFISGYFAKRSKKLLWEYETKRSAAERLLESFRRHDLVRLWVKTEN